MSVEYNKTKAENEIYKANNSSSEFGAMHGALAIAYALLAVCEQLERIEKKLDECRPINPNP